MRPPGLRAAGRRLGAVVERHADGIPEAPVLLVGAPGTGKTTLLKALASMAPVPVVTLDLAALAKDFTSFDLHPSFRHLVLAANYDLKAAERAVVILENLDVPGLEAVQWQLLGVLDGARVSIPQFGGPPTPHSDLLRLETGGMLFLAAVRSDAPDLIPPLAARLARRIRLHTPTLEDMLAELRSDNSAWAALQFQVEESLPEALERSVVELALSLQMGGWGLRHVVAALEEILEEGETRSLDLQTLHEAGTRLALRV